MQRILVVAHKTLGGEHLREEITRRLEDDECHFHLVVPEAHPNDHAWTDGECHRVAERVLDEGLTAFRELDPTGRSSFTGEVGETDPVHAVEYVFMRGDTFDEILLSTLPPGPSRWLKRDVPNRLRRATPLKITHVISARQRLSAV
jgi:hypothetical protein